jgi:predicted nucleotidyltransferase
MEVEISCIALLPEITQRILEVSDPEQIILFGSYARGDNGPDSDLDLLVVLRAVQSTRAESIRLKRALRGLLVPVDILVATPEQLERHRNTVGLIYRTVLSEGKLVYERPAAA